MIRLIQLELRNNRLLYIGLIPLFMLVAGVLIINQLTVNYELIFLLITLVNLLIAPLLMVQSLLSEKWFYYMTFLTKRKQLVTKLIIPLSFSILFSSLLLSISLLPQINGYLYQQKWDLHFIIRLFFSLNMVSVVLGLLTAIIILLVKNSQQAIYLILKLAIIGMLIFYLITLLPIIFGNINNLEVVIVVFSLALDFSLYLICDCLYRKLEV